MTFYFPSAQNLIPNPGFEEFDGSQVLDWIHRRIPYTHFEKDTSKNGLSHSGICFYGICVCNNNGSKLNEIVYIKLQEQLVAGKKYKLSLYARLWNNSDREQLSRIHEIQVCLFNKEGILTDSSVWADTTPTFIKFSIPNNVSQFQWNYFEKNYTAIGNEQYIALGHFGSFIKDSLPYYRFSDDTFRNLFEANASSDTLFSIELKDNLSKRKQKKENEKFKEQLFAYKLSKNKDSHLGNSRSYLGFPRIYFDDLCLASLLEDERCDCSENILAKKSDTTFQVGEIFTLKNIFFETAKADLLPQSFFSLDSLVNILKTFSSIQIQINGHTDNQGEIEFNQKLSEARVKSVIDYLVSKDISSERLVIKGFGMSQPISTNDTPEGRAENRRVEFVILKK